VAIDLARAYEDEVWHVYGFLAYRLGSRADAEDLTQQTFERAARAADRFDPDRATARTWLLSIASNVLVDHLRSAARRREVAADDPHALTRERAAPPEASLGIDADLEAALATLDARQREVVALRFGGDLRGREIAELMGLSLANVQQILTRALRALRRELEGSALEAS
jgi:RNA polymerase sigma-70 factor (ECF subfamily)